MIPAMVIKCAVGIPGHAHVFRHAEMVSRTIRVREETLPQQPRRPYRGIRHRTAQRPRPRHGNRVAFLAICAGGNHRGAFARQDQTPILDVDVAQQADLIEAPRFFPQAFIGKRPPRPGLEFPGDHARHQRGDGFPIQRLIVNARVADPSGKGMFRITGVEVTPTKQHDRRRTKCLRRIRQGVVRVIVAVAENGDLSTPVNHRQLDERPGRRGFVRPIPLLPRGAPESVAAGHPLPGRDFAEDNSIKMRFAVIQRQRAAGLLRQVGGRRPDDQGLVAK